ncbi:MAG: methionine--tRNA ligase [Patescibacteria group bacterium]
MINFDDFKKIELKIAKVTAAERVEGAEKLLKLQVDLGSDSLTGLGINRQIIAGIGKAHEPENLLGKEIAIVANLEPRQLMGLESQGMVLCAAGENGPVLLCPEKEVPPGAGIG